MNPHAILSLLYHRDADGIGPEVDESLRSDEMRAFLHSREIDGLLPRLGISIAPWDEIYRLTWATQLLSFKAVLRELSSAGVTPVLFKGAELISRFYPDTPLGFFVDADILIDRAQMQVAKSVLYSLGYTQSYYDKTIRSLSPRDVQDIGKIEATHYELAPFCKMIRIECPENIVGLLEARNDHPTYIDGRDLVIILEIDLHHNVAADTVAEPLLIRAVDSIFPHAKTLSPADHLWLNCSRYYNEVALFGKRSLRPLAYTAPLLRHETINWDIIREVARELGLSASLYYPLRILQAITGASIPSDILVATDPVRAGASRDLGWQLGPLLGFIEPFPVRNFSQ